VRGALYFDAVVYRKWLCSDDNERPDFGSQNGLTGHFHHVGTIRMADDQSKDVVDRRLHGISNLFIAGSSVFPARSYANPILTLIALT